jgi:hypothetical protein
MDMTICRWNDDRVHIFGHSGKCVFCGMSKDYKPEAPKPMAMNEDLGKIRYTLVPNRSTRVIAEIFTKGAKKYAIDNWKLLTVSNRIDAALRHIDSFRSGERNDAQDGFHNLLMAAADLIMAAENDLGDS